MQENDFTNLSALEIWTSFYKILWLLNITLAIYSTESPQDSFLGSRPEILIILYRDKIKTNLYFFIQISGLTWWGHRTPQSSIWYKLLTIKQLPLEYNSVYFPYSPVILYHTIIQYNNLRESSYRPIPDDGPVWTTHVNFTRNKVIIHCA
jgi:hypothetical protein